MSFLRDFPKADTPRARRERVLFTPQQPGCLATTFRRLGGNPHARIAELKVVLPVVPLLNEAYTPDMDGAVAEVTKDFLENKLPDLSALYIVAEDDGYNRDCFPQVPRSLSPGFSRKLRQLTLCHVTLSAESVAAITGAMWVENLSLVQVVSTALPESPTPFGDKLKRLQLDRVGDCALVTHLMRAIAPVGKVSLSVQVPSTVFGTGIRWGPIFSGELGGVESLSLCNAWFTDDSVALAAVWQGIARSRLMDLHIDTASFDEKAFKTFCVFLRGQTRLVSLRVSNSLYALTDSQRDEFLSSVIGGAVKWLSVSTITAAMAAKFATLLTADTACLEIVSLAIYTETERGRDNIELARRLLGQAAELNPHLGVIRDAERSAVASRMGLYGLHVSNVEPDIFCPSCGEPGLGVSCTELDNHLLYYARRNRNKHDEDRRHAAHAV